MAAAECAKLMTWGRQFLFDIMFPIISPSSFFVDNTSSIAFPNGESVKSKVKHIERCYYFIRDQVQAGALEVQHIPTTKMKADFLTKPLGPQVIQHEITINKLG